MFGNDPLAQYHSLLRLGSSSGYPNLQYANPHPYEMSMSGMKSRQEPGSLFRYDAGPKMRLYLSRQNRLRGIRSQPYRNSRLIAS